MGPRASSGFTLIETIVVLAILGLALTIVAGFAPRRNTTLELSAASSRIVDALRLARSRALMESRPVLFAAVPGGHGFRVDNAQVSLGSSVTVVVTQPTIVFAPDGSASGGTVRVLMSDRQRVIHVDWLTGRIDVAAVL